MFNWVSNTWEGTPPSSEKDQPKGKAERSRQRKPVNHFRDNCDLLVARRAQPKTLKDEEFIQRQIMLLVDRLVESYYNQNDSQHESCFIKSEKESALRQLLCLLMNFAHSKAAATKRQLRIEDMKPNSSQLNEIQSFEGFFILPETNTPRLKAATLDTGVSFQLPSWVPDVSLDYMKDNTANLPWMPVIRLSSNSKSRIMSKLCSLIDSLRLPDSSSSRSLCAVSLYQPPGHSKDVTQAARQTIVRTMLLRALRILSFVQYHIGEMSHPLRDEMTSYFHGAIQSTVRLESGYRVSERFNNPTSGDKRIVWGDGMSDVSTIVVAAYKDKGTQVNFGSAIKLKGSASAASNSFEDILAFDSPYTGKNRSPSSLPHIARQVGQAKIVIQSIRMNHYRTARSVNSQESDGDSWLLLSSSSSSDNEQSPDDACDSPSTGDCHQKSPHDVDQRLSQSPESHRRSFGPSSRRDRWRDSADDEEEEERPNKRRRDLSIPHCGAGVKARRRFACPYQACGGGLRCFQPGRGKRNHGGGCADIPKLKDHLKRKHMTSWRCPVCKVSYATRPAMESHRPQDCNNFADWDPHEKFMSKEQEREVGYICRSSGDEVDKWWRLFRLLIEGMQDRDVASLEIQYTPYYQSGPDLVIPQLTLSNVSLQPAQPSEPFPGGPSFIEGFQEYVPGFSNANSTSENPSITQSHVQTLTMPVYDGSFAQTNMDDIPMMDYLAPQESGPTEIGHASSSIESLHTSTSSSNNYTFPSLTPPGADSLSSLEASSILPPPEPPASDPTPPHSHPQSQPQPTAAPAAAAAAPPAGPPPPTPPEDQSNNNNNINVTQLKRNYERLRSNVRSLEAERAETHEVLQGSRGDVERANAVLEELLLGDGDGDALPDHVHDRLSEVADLVVAIRRRLRL